MKNYKTIITIILYLFSYQFIFSQNNSQIQNSSTVFDTTLSFTLNKFFEPYFVHFVIIDSNDITIYSAKIYNNKKVFIQSINDTINFMGKEARMMVDRFSAEPQNPNFNDDISFVDINFDGYTDIKIKSLVSVQGQSDYSFYLYNPGSNNFIYNKEFSNLCCNLSLDYKSKEISISDYTWQDETWKKWTYKVIDNKPTLYTIQTEHVYTEDNKQKFRTIIEKLINGEMKVVKDTVEWKEK